MVNSIVINDLPAGISDTTLLRFIRNHSALCHVEHIQPFPDAYHHVNERAGTRSVQIFVDATREDELRKLFEDDGTLEQLARLEGSTQKDVPPTRVRRMSVSAV
ncbi:(ZYRO0F10582g) [Zygosaccharomyces parabailii]|nr:(ZYRO0F10582g) [Zygosaccharomyces parabailii]CDH10597.1 uncharacterized protein ZBAI_02383 [Zygosaccharomyces bailii ISA1307]